VRRWVGLIAVATLFVLGAGSSGAAKAPTSTTYVLKVTLVQAGTVTDADINLHCSTPAYVYGKTCPVRVSPGQSVSLTATGQLHYEFKKWGGACKNTPYVESERGGQKVQDSVCNLRNIRSSLRVVARFAKRGHEMSGITPRPPE
jgi:hypothetical protein